MNSFYRLPLVLSFALLLQACAGIKSTANSKKGSQVYSKSYEEMTEIVEKAIRNSNINISFVSASDNDERLTLTISRERNINLQSVQQEQGEVRIIKMGEKETRVEIDNPQYHYSVPEHQKEDYQRIIFLRIKDIMEK